MPDIGIETLSAEQLHWLNRLVLEVFGPVNSVEECAPVLQTLAAATHWYTHRRMKLQRGAD
jgi:hypothetical protein